MAIQLPTQPIRFASVTFDTIAEPLAKQREARAAGLRAAAGEWIVVQFTGAAYSRGTGPANSH